MYRLHFTNHWGERTTRRFKSRAKLFRLISVFMHPFNGEPVPLSSLRVYGVAQDGTRYRISLRRWLNAL